MRFAKTHQDQGLHVRNQRCLTLFLNDPLIRPYFLVGGDSFGRGILDSHGRIFLTRISSPKHRLTSHPIPRAGAHDTKGPITNHTFRVIGALQKTAGFSTGFPTPAVSHRGGWLVFRFSAPLWVGRVFWG